MAKLTKKVVEAAKPEGRDTFLWDDELPCFGLRVFASGKRSYLVQYRADGRTRRVTIGFHGHLTAEQARKKAEVLLGKIADGENPAEDKILDRKAITVRQLCARYLKAAKDGTLVGRRGLTKKASTISTDEGRISRHIIPLLGNRKVRDLTPPDINKFQRDVTSGKTAANVKTKRHGRAIVTGGAGTASRTVGLLGGILTYAVNDGIIKINPVHGVPRPADNKRKVRLSPEQYRTLALTLAKAEERAENWQGPTAIRLVSLTGCRRSEIIELKWDDVDIDGGCLRLSDTKTGKSVRPIGRLVAELLKSLKEERRVKNNPFVLPGVAKPGTHFAALPQAWERLMALIPEVMAEAETRGEELAPLPSGLTLHGLRHAYASVGADLGMTEITIAACIGHALGSATGRHLAKRLAEYGIESQNLWFGHGIVKKGFTRAQFEDAFARYLPSPTSGNAAMPLGSAGNRGDVLVPSLADRSVASARKSLSARPDTADIAAPSGIAEEASSPPGEWEADL